MKYFNHQKRDLTSGPHLIGLILVFAGAFALLSPTLFAVGSSMQRVIMVGLGAILIGLFILVTFEGTLIDVAGRRFKEYTSIGGYKWGEWTALPEIANIKVTSVTYQSTNTPNGVSPTLSGKITEHSIMLYADEHASLLSFNYSNKHKAVKQAKSLAAELKVALTIEEQ